MVKLKTYYVTRDESLPVTHWWWWSKLSDSIQIGQVRRHQWPEVIRHSLGNNFGSLQFDVGLRRPIFLFRIEAKLNFLL